MRGSSGMNGQMYGLAAGGDDALLETDDFLFAGLVLTIAGGELDFQMVGIEEMTITTHGFYLAGLGHPGQSAGEPVDHLDFVSTQLVQIDGWLAEDHAEFGEMFRLVHDGGDVQQRLGRDAADVETDAAQGGVALHQNGLHAQIGGAESGAVTARTRAEHQHFAFQIHRAGIGTGGGCNGWGRG